MAERRTRKTRRRLAEHPDEEKTVQGKLNLPLLSRVFNGLGMGRGGGRSGYENYRMVARGCQRFLTGFPIVGSGAVAWLPVKKCAELELAPRQLLPNAKWGNKVRAGAATSPHGGTHWEEALDYVVEGCLDGAFPFGEDGRLIAGQAPQMVNPAFRFGLQEGE